LPLSVGAPRSQWHSIIQRHIANNDSIHTRARVAYRDCVRPKDFVKCPCNNNNNNNNTGR